VVPGAGAFEVAAAHHLRTKTIKSVEGRAKLGVEAFAEVRRLAVLPACLLSAVLLRYLA
jgi:T-complex protein 1 subunit zeta